ncbi:MAG: hypothetical protein EOO27_02305 [Comamonadaceae bacterium]|nr:MAG: hypothetical protein EOO27_02305 [Comamonadaceae bacterium]
MASHIQLPKPDRRYKVGKISADSKGNLRGHPDTVTVKRMDIPATAPEWMKLNPPMVVSEEFITSIKLKTFGNH